MRVAALWLVLVLLPPHPVATALPRCFTRLGIAIRQAVTGYEVSLSPRYGATLPELGKGSHATASLGRLPADFANFLKAPPDAGWQAGTEVALKKPLPIMQAAGRKMIEHEADMMAKVAAHDPDHLFARGALDAQAGVLVQEYRKGYVKLLDLPKPIRDETRRAIARQLDAALGVLSNANVVHSDLKPDNILIDPTTHRIMIIDFSNAAATDGYPAWKPGRQRGAGNSYYHSPASRADRPAAKLDDAYSVGRVRRWMERPR